MMTHDPLILRGRVLTFMDEPSGPDDRDAFSYVEDGAVAICDGIIVARGAFEDVAASTGYERIVDHRPHILMAGFIDTHIHFPQVQIIGSWGEQLLDWLNNYTFPAELQYGDGAHCEAMAGAFFDQLVDHGTTTAVAFCSVHIQSADAYFAEAHRRGMCMMGGKVMMDRNAPVGLMDDPQSGYDDTVELIKRWHGVDRLRYAISPRFAITSTPAQMEAAGTLAEENPDCLVQTHLSENQAEIAYAKELYPDARDYLDIYESYGLLNENLLLGHAIHLTDREVNALADSGAHPVHCPTSNLFLGSGLFNLQRLAERGIDCGIATDVGAGTSYSMLQTASEGYKVLQLQQQAMHPLKSFHWITRGNARVLGMEEKIGTLEVGSEADVVVLNSSATSAMALRMQRCNDLSEELFVLQTMGDDRAIDQVYIAGVASKKKPHPGF